MDFSVNFHLKKKKTFCTFGTLNISKQNSETCESCSTQVREIDSEWMEKERRIHTARSSSRQELSVSLSLRWRPSTRSCKLHTGCCNPTTSSTVVYLLLGVSEECESSISWGKEGGDMGTERQLGQAWSRRKKCWRGEKRKEFDVIYPAVGHNFTSLCLCISISYIS